MRKALYSLAAIICGFSIFTSAIPASHSKQPDNVLSPQMLVDSIGSTEPMRSALLGVLAVRGESDTIVAYNPFCKLKPASNTKLLTTGISMLRLGPDWQYSTYLKTDSHVSGGELEGDLYIVGTGDPSIGVTDYEGNPSLEATFAQWKAILDKKGIKRIKGCVIGDGRWFGGNHIPVTWEYDDLISSYSGACEALNVNENCVRVKISNVSSPGQRINGIVADKPALPWMKFISEACSVGGRGYNISCYPSIVQPNTVVTGNIGVKRKTAYTFIKNFFGAYTCAQLFHDYLVKNGISVGGGYADISPSGIIRKNLNNPVNGPKAETKLSVLGEYKSAKLKQMIGDCNRESDNFYAEAFLRTLGKDLTGSASYKSCSAARDTMFRRLGLRIRDGYRIVDGCGLSTENYVSPDFFVRFLKAMSKTHVFPEYLESLPNPGEGTLISRIKKEPDSVKARVCMKSGSIDGTVCFSGYILAESGNPDDTIYFSIMSNNVTGSSSHLYHLMDQIIARLAHEN